MAQYVQLKNGEICGQEDANEILFGLHSLKYMNSELLAKLIVRSTWAVNSYLKSRQIGDTTHHEIFDHQFIFTGTEEEMHLLLSLKLGVRPREKSLLISIVVYQVLHAAARDGDSLTQIGDPYERQNGKIIVYNEDLTPVSC